MTSYKKIEIRAAAGLHEDCARSIAQYVTPGASVIDLAAGAGAFSARLKDMGYSVIANDIDDKNWAVPQVEKLTVDLDSDFLTQINRKDFDAVIAMEVIEHLQNPSKFLSDCRRLVKSDGVILLSTPNVLDIQSRSTYIRTGVLFHFSPESFRATGHRTILPYWLLEILFEQAGLEVVDRQFSGQLEFPRKSNPISQLAQATLTGFVRILTKNAPRDVLDSNYVIYILRSATYKAV